MLLKKHQLLLLILSIIPLFIKAQVSSYNASQTAGVYTPITGGTVYGNTSSDEQLFVDPAIPAGGFATSGVGLPIGFNFTFDGSVFDRLAINNNGWIVLGQSALTPAVNFVVSTYTPISSTSTTTPSQLGYRISAFGRDLSAQAGSSLRVETIGTAPNRECVIQWTNYRRYNAVGNNFNFQIRLKETTNIVEVVYGNFTTTETSTQTAQVGLRGITNADFNNRTVVNGTHTWATSSFGITNASTCSFSNVLTPVSGQTYRWTPPSCVSSTGLAVSGITANTANFSWLSSLPSGQIVIVPAGNAVTTGTPIAVSGTNFTGSSLTPATNYQVYLRKVCGIGDTSNWSLPVSFTTACLSTTIPWSESFESVTVATTNGPIPSCWNRNIVDFATANGAQTNNRSARTGTKYLYTAWSTVAGTGDWVFTPEFNLTAGVSYDFSFFYKTDGLVGWDTLRVGVGNAQTAASMSIIGTKLYAVNNTAYTEYLVSYTPTISGAHSFGVNVWASNSPWYMSFDDFNVRLTPTCPQPTTLTVTNITESSADFSWTSVAPGSSFYVSIVPQGSPANSATSILTSNSTYSFAGLTPNTPYSLYVREYCSVGDTSIWSGPLNFSTPCPAAGLPGNTTNTAIEVNSLNYTATGNTVYCYTNTIGNTSPDVWYRVILDPCATSISANLCTGTNFDSYLRIYASDGLTQLAFNDDGCGAQSIISNLDITTYDTIYVVVEGFSSSVGTYSLNITQTTSVPPIADISYTSSTYCGGANLNPIPTNNGTVGGLFSEGSNTLPINPTSGEITLTSALAGNYSIIYSVTNGQMSCNSIDTAVIVIYPQSTGIDVITACDSYTWIDGVTYTISNNTATHTLSNINGCDSIVTLNLTINYSTTGTDVITACDSYTWIDGVTYNSSNNTATHTLTNINGCDSIVTLNLTINYSTTGTDVITACDSYTWIDGLTYTSSNNTATHTLTNIIGCDSIVTLNLTINYSTTGTDVITACDSYTWIDGVTYTSSNNTATHTLTNINGCDSIVTLNLTINYSTTGTDVITACDSYTWIDGVTYTSSNNTATHTLTNINGCDSIVTLNLSINNVSIITTSISGNTITANNASASYLWLDCNNNFNPISNETAQSFTPTVNGDYAVQLTENGCVDTSSCVTISTIGIEEHNFLSNITVYPNPTQGNVSIDLGEIYENITIKTMNKLGQVIQNTTYSNQQKIDLFIDGERGAYLIEITNNEGFRKIVKLIKN